MGTVWRSTSADGDHVEEDADHVLCFIRLIAQTLDEGSYSNFRVSVTPCKEGWRHAAICWFESVTKSLNDFKEAISWTAEHFGEAEFTRAASCSKTQE